MTIPISSHGSELSGDRAALMAAATTSVDALQAAVLEWLRGELPPEWVAAIDRDDSAGLRAARERLDEARWWRRLAASGLVAPGWPTHEGGLGLSGAHITAIARALRLYKAPRSSNPIGLNMVAPALLKWGTDAQRKRYLPGIADHSEIWCQLFSEPGAGSDLASLSARAQFHDGGWTITGQKVWTSLGHVAARGLLLARTDPAVPKHEGITAFLVDMRAPGVEVRPLRQITGDAEFNQVFLDGVAVDSDDVLGEVGEGWNLARSVLAHERVSDSGAGVQPGVIAGRSIEDLMSRFGAGASSELRVRLVRSWIDAEVLRLCVARSRTPGSSIDPTITKLLSTGNSQRLQDLAVDLGGLSGIAWDPEDRWSEMTAWSYLRVQAKTIAGGTLDITKNLCGERVLGLPREPSVDRGVPWNQVRRSEPIPDPIPEQP